MQQTGERNGSTEIGTLKARERQSCRQGGQPRARRSCEGRGAAREGNERARGSNVPIDRFQVEAQDVEAQVIRRGRGEAEGVHDEEGDVDDAQVNVGEEVDDPSQVHVGQEDDHPPQDVRDQGDDPPQVNVSQEDDDSPQDVRDQGDDPPQVDVSQEDDDPPTEVAAEQQRDVLRAPTAARGT
jgi:hypothetical protein